MTGFQYKIKQTVSSTQLLMGSILHFTAVLITVLVLTLWLAVAVDGQAFSVASTQTFQGDELLHVPFDKMIYNDGTYNEQYNNFTCEVPGIYYFSFSAGLEAGMGAVMYLQRNVGTGSEVTNHDTHTNGIGISSRGVFQNVQSGTFMRMRAVLDDTHSLQGDPVTHQTTWNGFLYNDIAETDIAFSVANTVNLTSSQNPMVFDTEVLNIGWQGPAFNMSTGIFTAQRRGIYFFQVSAGAREEREVRVNITMTNETLIGSLVRTGRIHNGVDTLSRTLMVDLALNDQISLMNVFGSELYSAGGYQTSFSGFLYATNAQPGPAFMAYRSESWESEFTEAPLRYDMVDVNKGDLYDPLSGTFTCNVQGQYYFSLSAGAIPQKAVSITLYLNTDAILRLTSQSTFSNGIDTISRDVIVQLENGDSLHVEASGGTGLFSDIGRQTSFMGFRIR